MHHHNMTNILHMGVSLIEMEGSTGEQLGIGGAILERAVRCTVLFIPRIDQPRDLIVIMISDRISRCVGIGRVYVRVGTTGCALVNVNAGCDLRFHSGELGLHSERS